MTTTTYAIALGANRSSRLGTPRAAIRAALDTVGGVIAVSPIVASDPVGPSRRRYANAAALIASAETPRALLARLKRIERLFGRRGGRRWGDRVIDLDLILWSGGSWRDRVLTVPHPRFRARGFVLRPLAAIAPGWRDPLTGRRVRHLARLVDRRVPRS